MFHIQGRVTERTLLPDGNYLLWLRREQRGLIGHELALLVPPLVFTRDGWPTPGQWVEITVQELGGSAAVGGECELAAVYCSLRHAGETTPRDS